MEPRIQSVETIESSNIQPKETMASQETMASKPRALPSQSQTYSISTQSQSPAQNDSEFQESSESLSDDDAELETAAEFPRELLEIINPHVDEDSPAAAALRANAELRVSKVGKAARSMNAQAIRKIIKQVSLRNHYGNIKGKPPRVPPSQRNLVDNMYALDEILEEDFNGPDDAIQEVEASERSEHAVQAPIRDLRTANMQPKEKSDDLPANMSFRIESDVPADVVAGTLEAGQKVMKSVDPHDILKLTRWKRKKKKAGKKERKSYVKGKVIDSQHERYTQAIAIMLGVRTSIAKTNALITAAHKKRWVTEADFHATQKYEFAPGGSDITPPHQLAHTFKFKDYSPVVFAYMRRLFGINEFDFLLSVCGKANFIEFISNAKSGQFFFYSNDGKYMIKTMTNAESKFLRRILPEYFKHCCENPNTMLTKFFGMYRVKLYHLRKNAKFVIMNSVYHTDKPLQEFYDLKGSIAGRTARPDDDVKKDNDLRKKMPGAAMVLAPQTRERVRRQLIRDCNFLQKVGVMDYSMLVGIHYVSHSKAHGDGQQGRNNARASARRASLRKLNNLDNLSASGEGSNSHDDFANNGSQVSWRGRLGDMKDESFRRSVNEMSDNLGAPIAILEDMFDEDESSFLEGSDQRAGNSSPSLLNPDIERKKQQTIEQIYWPFHRLHDIHGYRRMKPGPCFHCKRVPCDCPEHEEVLKGVNIPEFVSPLSDRKDGGLTLDLSGMEVPMKCRVPKGDMLCDGKLFYMGIIDILQEYNARKRIETKYRQFQGMDALEASCVSPRDYSARFLKFFDMYTQKPVAALRHSESQPHMKKSEDTGNMSVEVAFDGHTSMPALSRHSPKR